MPITASELARVAGEAFTTRQARAREAIRRGESTLDKANVALRPWLAIACLCGADLPDLEEPIASYRTLQCVAGAEPPTFTEAQARGLIADEICPRATWVRILATARDNALERAEAKGATAGHIETARALVAICAHLWFDINGRHHIPRYREGFEAAPARAAA